MSIVYSIICQLFEFFWLSQQRGSAIGDDPFAFDHGSVGFGQLQQGDTTRINRSTLLQPPHRSRSLRHAYSPHLGVTENRRLVRPITGTQATAFVSFDSDVAQNAIPVNFFQKCILLVICFCISSENSVKL